MTKALRPRALISKRDAIRARRMKRRHRGMSEADIAARLGGGVTEEGVRQALEVMRTRNPSASRATLNVTTAARDFVEAEKQDGEPTWEVVDDLFGELAMARVELKFWRELAGASGWTFSP